LQGLIAKLQEGLSVGEVSKLADAFDEVPTWVVDWSADEHYSRRCDDALKIH
jgi:hypothetical protein